MNTGMITHKGAKHSNMNTGMITHKGAKHLVIIDWDF
jgi:hypothetical protein